jgi:DNA-binding IclR family transcriptional regulator
MNNMAREVELSMERPTEDAGSAGIQVIARAADILRALRTAPGGLSQAEVAERVGLARSTIHRLLNALEDEGLVESGGPRGRYRLGPEINRMADTARRGLLSSIHPLLEELSQEVNETVDLSVLDRSRATFVDQVVAPHRLRAVSSVGESFLLHCTANGKAFLAAMSPQDLARATSGNLPQLTAHTITEPAALLQELDRVRAEGIAYDREENSEGICAVGTTIRGLTGVAVAVSVPLPAQRFYGREPLLRDALLNWSQRVERELSAGGEHSGPAVRRGRPAGGGAATPRSSAARSRMRTDQAGRDTGQGLAGG